jgi:hypothetical protein
MNIDLVALSLDVRTVEEVQTTFVGVAIMRLLEDTAGPYQTNLMGADRTHTMSFYAMKYENYLGANEKTAVSNSSQESFLLLALVTHGGRVLVSRDKGLRNFCILDLVDSASSPFGISCC